MNRQPALSALLPLGVVTVTHTVPDPAGETALIEVSDFTSKLVALVVPNFTAVAPVKRSPLIVTALPPACGPLAGSIFVTSVPAGQATGAVCELAPAGTLVQPDWMPP